MKAVIFSNVDNTGLELKGNGGGGGKTYRKGKPREDGLLETMFGESPKAVSEESNYGKSWKFLRDLRREMEWGGARPRITKKFPKMGKVNPSRDVIEG